MKYVGRTIATPGLSKKERALKLCYLRRQKRKEAGICRNCNKSVWKEGAAYCKDHKGSRRHPRKCWLEPTQEQKQIYQKNLLELKEIMLRNRPKVSPEFGIYQSATPKKDEKRSEILLKSIHKCIGFPE